MGTSANKIRKDIFTLYSYLYPKDANERETMTRVMSKDMLRLLKYHPDEVEAALFFQDAKQPKPGPSDAIMDAVKNREDVRRYYIEHFQDILTPTATEQQISEHLSQITLRDMKYLYSCLIDIPVNGKPTKVELLYKIRDYFDSEKRTNDLAKNLY